MKVIGRYFGDFKFEECNKISMDSNKVEKGDVFLAINNGNSYIDEALKKGAVCVIADKKQSSQDGRVIYVENTVKFMQEIANLYRKELGVKVIGITGSNGKTTTKDILYSILSQKYKVEKTEGNYNNHIGLPFTILNTKEDTEYLILEMGMSALGEINLLGKIAEPDYGIITNIGLSHMEELKTQENVFKAKTELLKYLKRENIFINGDDEYLSKVIGNQVGFFNLEDQRIDENHRIKLFNYRQQENGIFFSVDNKEFFTTLCGEYNASNCGLAIALARAIGVEDELIQKGLYKIELSPMRFQYILWRGMDLINDAYNASPLSMKEGLEAFANIYNKKFTIAVIGDMLELGEREIQYHYEVIEKGINLKYNKIFLYGDRMNKAFELLKKSSKNIENIEHFMDKKEIKERLLSFNCKEVAIYLKGSRGMKLEEVLK